MGRDKPARTLFSLTAHTNKLIRKHFWILDKYIVLCCSGPARDLLLLHKLNAMTCPPSLELHCRTGPSQTVNTAQPLTNYHPFPRNNFKYFLTLFSKFFSSFPHGTCSLSVSRQYLALDGIYHLLWAEFPINPTRRQRLVECLTSCPTGFSPSRTPCAKGLGHDAAQSTRL